MVTAKIQDYIQVRGEVSVPELQQKFRLNYAEARAVITQLEKDGVLTLREGITYEFTGGAVNSDDEFIFEYGDGLPVTRAELMQMLQKSCSDGTPYIYVKILHFIIEQGKVNVRDIQRRFATSMLLTDKVVEWCEKKGYITPPPERKVILTREGFDARYKTGGLF